MSEAAGGRDRTGTMLNVNEIFRSIQGESSRSGRPCIFVRLTACNLRCVWCDTAYAFEEGKAVSVGRIVEQVDRWDLPFVLVTGGEPLLQPGVHDLIGELLDCGREVAIETGGSLDVSPLDRRVAIVMDLKCPGSGMVGQNDWRNLDRLKPGDEVKFVLADRADYEWSVRMIREHHLTERFGVLLSPVHGVLHPRDLAEWMLSDQLNARLQLQIHKYIWPADMRGI